MTALTTMQNIMARVAVLYGAHSVVMGGQDSEVWNMLFMPMGARMLC